MLTDPDSVEVITDKLDTPIQVLRLLRKTQETAVLSMRKAADFQSALDIAKKHNALVESKCSSLEAELLDAKLSNDKSNKQTQVLVKQTELYEKEVESLRLLLKSFDAECRIILLISAGIC